MVWLLNYNPIELPLTLTNITGYYLNAYLFEGPTIVIETGKTLPPSHVSLSTSLNCNREYALLSPHQTYYSIWMKMLSPFYKSLDFSVEPIPSTMITRHLAFNRHMAHAKCSIFPAFNCPDCSVSLLGKRSFLEKYATAHIQSHDSALVTAMMSYCPPSFPWKRNIPTALLADSLVVAKDKYVSIFNPHGSLTVPLSALAISYSKSLLVTGKWSYFTIERTLYMLEKLVQCYFKEALPSSLSFPLLKNILYHINTFAHARAYLTNPLQIQLQNEHTKIPRNKRMAASVSSGHPSKMFASLSPVLEQPLIASFSMHASVLMQEENPEIENPTRCLQEHSMVSFTQLSKGPVALASSIPFEEHAAMFSPRTSISSIGSKPESDKKVRCRYEFVFGQHNISLFCHFNRYSNEEFYHTFSIGLHYSAGIVPIAGF